MPKDHSKTGYRGIGFVTFASPDSVEKVMASKHWLNGHEIAIDRATPKEEPTALKTIFARLPVSNGQRRSFDNGGYSCSRMAALPQLHPRITAWLGTFACMCSEQPQLDGGTAVHLGAAVVRA